jgi:photosystem II stability/assembly factor-like uncharacterized protein
MKKCILFIVAMFFGLFNIVALAQGGWFLQNNPTTSRGVSTKFVSATEGWINLSQNALLHTTNGGTNWNVVVPNTTDITVGFDATSQQMSFINSSTGWVMKSLTNSNEDALGAVVYRTINGGATWNRTVLSNTIGDVGIQLQFVDSNYGWALVYNMNTGTPTFLKTTNGGTNWTPTNGGGIFYYVNSTIGYAFAAGPNMLPPYTIYKTTDGGTNWIPQYVDNTAGELSAINFTDVNNGWIVGREGKILKTTNGGANWTTITNTGINSTYRNLEVQFLTANLGWIATRDGMNNQFILKTTNGGTSWTMQQLPFSSKTTSMFFWDDNNGWVTSDSYNQGGTDYPGQIAKYLYNPAGTYTNATLNGPWFVYADLTPIDPFNDNLNYIVFNGNGLITDFNGFGGPWLGNYTVNSSGVISGNITDGIENYIISGLLTSTTEGTAQLGGQNWRLHKVANPGALKDKITGTLTTDDCGSRNVIINIDDNGIITSATGLIGPVVGRVYTDLGVYIGHMTTGEGVHWSELTITGYYSNNNLVGELGLDADSNTCVNGTSNLIRTDNLGINDNYFETKGIIIYPNPNNGLFHFDIKEPAFKLQIEIYNVLGQKVYENTNLDQKVSNEIYFEPQAKGVYYITINDGKNMFKEKIMIK